jgi:group I intron endonuclease
MKSGIYAIFGPNGRRYIGSTVNLINRRRSHFRDLRGGRHHSRALQRAFTKYGESAFTFAVLELVAPDSLLTREQWYFDNAPARTLYNSSLTAGNCLGVKHTAETRAKLSAARKGRHVSVETCAKISRLKTGLVCKPETRAKISATKQGQLRHTAKQNNTSGYCGVHWLRDRNKWQARVRMGTTRYHVGTFDSAAAAAAAIQQFKIDRMAQQ